MVGSGMKTGLNIIMDNPKTVGSDQIVDAVAALKEYPCPIIVIDMGTATTMSVIDKDGKYIGRYPPRPESFPGFFKQQCGPASFYQPGNPWKSHRQKHYRLYAQRYFIWKCRPDGRHHRSDGRRAGGNRFCSCHRRPLPLRYPSVPS